MLKPALRLPLVPSLYVSAWVSVRAFAWMTILGVRFGVNPGASLWLAKLRKELP
jgi:hypothetical protein